MIRPHILHHAGTAPSEARCRKTGGAPGDDATVDGTVTVPRSGRRDQPHPRPQFQFYRTGDPSCQSLRVGCQGLLMAGVCFIVSAVLIALIVAAWAAIVHPLTALLAILMLFHWAWLVVGGEPCASVLLRLSNQKARRESRFPGPAYLTFSKKRRVSSRPEARSTFGRQPMTRPASAGSTELRSCSPSFPGPYRGGRSLPNASSSNL